MRNRQFFILIISYSLGVLSPKSLTSNPICNINLEMNPITKKKDNVLLVLLLSSGIISFIAIELKGNVITQ